MNKTGLFNELRTIIRQEQIVPLEGQISKINDMLTDHQNIDIALLGQFKVGKSSFINSFAGREILPVGVIPVTSVITSVSKGDREKVTVCFDDGNNREIAIDDLNEYINESNNPSNIKRVREVSVTLTGFDLPDGLRLVDTPGLGSFWKHNTLTTKQWLGHVGVALVAISADRPLGADELKLIGNILNETPEVAILITKTDLFTGTEIEKIEDYIRQVLQKEFGQEFRMFRYSSRVNTAAFNEEINRKLIQPLNDSFDSRRNSIVEHKIKSLAGQCVAYLDMARISALRDEDQREKLKKEIFTRKTNHTYLAREMAVVLSDQLNGIRERLLEMFLPEQETVVKQLQYHFSIEYPGWKGNLNRRTQMFEDWLKHELTPAMTGIAEKHEQEINSITREAAGRFSFFAAAFRNGLREQIEKTLGIIMPFEDPEIPPAKLHKPDISITRTFDSHIDLLWFLIPMTLFGKTFGNYFSGQVARQVEINIHRLASAFTSTLTRIIRKVKTQTQQSIAVELNTIERILTTTSNESVKYEQLIERIRSQIQQIR